jgi:hypothetical protein
MVPDLQKKRQMWGLCWFMVILQWLSNAHFCTDWRCFRSC